MLKMFSYIILVFCLLISNFCYSKSSSKPKSEPSASPLEPVSVLTTSSCVLDAVNKTLTSPKGSYTSKKEVLIEIKNYLPVPLVAYIVDTNGKWLRLTQSSPHSSGKNTSTYTPILPAFLAENGKPSNAFSKVYFNVPAQNFYMVFTDLIMGGIASVVAVGDAESFLDSQCRSSIKLNANDQYRSYITIDTSSLGVPNSIGSPPKMNSISPIPSDSMPILVGATYLGTFSVDKDGKAPKSSDDNYEANFAKVKAARVITRHQYWGQAPNSLVVAPHEFVVYKTEMSYGTEVESSDQQSFSASLGLSASAGYGPVSASVSASLSASSSFAHSITIQKSQKSSYEKTINNSEGDKPLILQFFQLTDVLTAAGWDSHHDKMISSAVLIQLNTPAHLATE